jgi:hypothetical protein
MVTSCLIVIRSTSAKESYERPISIPANLSLESTCLSMYISTQSTHKGMDAIGIAIVTLFVESVLYGLNLVSLYHASRSILAKRNQKNSKMQTQHSIMLALVIIVGVFGSISVGLTLKDMLTAMPRKFRRGFPFIPLLVRGLFDFQLSDTEMVSGDISTCCLRFYVGEGLIPYP